MNLKYMALKVVKQIFGLVGLEVKEKYPDFFLHEYTSYGEYKEIQIFHNKQKLQYVWADKETLSLIIDRVVAEFGHERELFAICHGTRNGFEQNFIATKLDVNIIGTDISDTAKQFPKSVQWDFHDKNDDWVCRNDFIYTNSLDHSWKPKSAVATWLDQLKTGGLLFIEHTEDHGVQEACAMDPFGANPNYIPFILSDWFGHLIAIEIIKSTKSNSGKKCWVFVVKKLSNQTYSVAEGEVLG